MKSTLEFLVKHFKFGPSMTDNDEFPQVYGEEGLEFLSRWTEDYFDDDLR